MENSVLDKLSIHFSNHSQVALGLGKRPQLKAHLTSIITLMQSCFASTGAIRKYPLPMLIHPFSYWELSTGR